MEKKLFLLTTLIFICLLLPVSAQKVMVKTTKVPAEKPKTALQKNLTPVASQITCKIGAPGLGGGTVFFENPNYSKDGYRYLEAFWSDETLRLPYSKATAFLKEFNSLKGKAGSLNTLKKSDWYIPSETELNSLISELGYPKGMLPAGSYFVSGGKKTVSFDYNIKTKSRTLNKVPEKFSKNTALKGKAIKNLNAAKLKALETKKTSLNIAGLVLVRKITNEELKTQAPKFNLTIQQSPGASRTLPQGVSASSSQTQTQAQSQTQVQTQATDTFPFTAASANTNRYNYTEIDNYVINLAVPDSMSLEDAARKICQTARNDREKARAIYIWIAANISYDRDSLYLTEAEQDEIGIRDADKTFARRMGVCTGYSALYSKMAKTAGLDAKELGGLIIPDYYQFGDDVTTDENAHAWNSVKIGNETILLDTTWAASSSEFGSSVPEINDAWFDCDKELFAMTHFPLKLSEVKKIKRPYIDEQESQALSKPFSRDMFKATPYINPALSVSGTKGTDVISYLKSNPKSWAMFMFKGMGLVVKDGLKINKYEMSEEIVTGESVVFNFSFPTDKGVYIYFNGREIADVQNNKDHVFTFDEPGELIIRYGPPVGTVTGFIRYNVVSARTQQSARENAVRAAFAAY